MKILNKIRSARKKRVIRIATVALIMFTLSPNKAVAAVDISELNDNLAFKIFKALGRKFYKTVQKNPGVSGALGVTCPQCLMSTSKNLGLIERTCSEFNRRYMCYLCIKIAMQAGFSGLL